MNVQRLFKHRSNKQSAVVSGWLIKLSHVFTTAGFWSPFFSLYNVIYSYAFASIQGLCRGTRDSCHVVLIGIMVESLCCESFVNPKPFVLLFLHVSLFSGKSHRVQASSHCEKSRWSLRDSMQEFLEMVNLSEEKCLSWEDSCVCTFAATNFPSVKGWPSSHLEPTQGLEALVENHQVGQVTCSLVWGAAGARAGVKTWPRRWWRARRTHIARWTSCFFPFSKCVLYVEVNTFSCLPHFPITYPMSITEMFFTPDVLKSYDAAPGQHTFICFSCSLSNWVSCGQFVYDFHCITESVLALGHVLRSLEGADVKERARSGSSVMIHGHCVWWWEMVGVSKLHVVATIFWELLTGTDQTCLVLCPITCKVVFRCLLLYSFYWLLFLCCRNLPKS